MKVNLNEQRILEVLNNEYMSATDVKNKNGMNWFVAFGTLCMLALQGKIETIKTAKNYLFKKRMMDVI